MLVAYFCRYDVALASNTFGTAHICQFARQCSHLKLLLHISTGKSHAYVRHTYIYIPVLGPIKIHAAFTIKFGQNLNYRKIFT
jgi:hypothetical protein